MPGTFTPELTFGPYQSGIWQETAGQSYRTILSGSFSPAALFAAGEQGFWYDPSDLSTMYQDSGGTTPVTAAGQPVGLMLDKSRGLALGGELISNGDFSGGATGWILGTGWAVSAGAAVKAVADSAFGRVSQSVGLAAGKYYVVAFTITATSGLASLNFSGASVGSGRGSGSYTVIAPFVGNGTVAFEGDASFVGSVDNISVKELLGNHATQATTANKPILRQSGSLYYLEFDGVDDGLSTGTITPGVDKVQVFAGMTKTSDAARGMVVEHSATAEGTAGAFYLDAPINPGTTDIRFGSSGSALNSGLALATSLAAPVTKVITGLGDISADSSIIRVNGIQAASSGVDQGTGNYTAQVIYLGRRSGTSLPFNGNIYALIGRFGANLTAGQITQMENWVSQKTGVIL